MWLLFWPCAWGVALAGGTQLWWHMLLMLIGATVMRAAGCVWNDILDQKLDAVVERTKNRPLAAGILRTRHALVFMALLCSIGLIILLQFNHFTAILGISSLALVALYPLAKRVTNYPQIVLGLTFNWGALMGWAATYGTLNTHALWLYAAGVFWTLGYDTIYALQDSRDDAIAGIGSTARAFGAYAQQWIATFYGTSVVCLLLSSPHHVAAYSGIAAFAAHLGWQVWRLTPNNTSNCLILFKSNAIAGGLLAIGVLFATLN